MNSEGESHNSVNRKALRELLTNSFNYEDLKDLCFDHYPDLYDNLGSNFGKNVIARLLIDYCERHGLIEHLLSLVKIHNPYQFSLYVDALTEPPVSPPPTASEETRVTLKLLFPDLNIEAFTLDKQAALIELIAEELNIPPESITILEIRQGSVIVILQLPASAATLLISLLQAGHPVVQDLRIGQIEAVPLRVLWRIQIVRFLTRLVTYLKLPLVLTFTLGLVVGLVTGSLTTVLSQEQSVSSQPTVTTNLSFVTATPTSHLPLSAAHPTVSGAGNEIGLPASPADNSTPMPAQPATTSVLAVTPVLSTVAPLPLLTPSLLTPGLKPFLPEPVHTPSPSPTETPLPTPDPTSTKTVPPIPTQPTDPTQTLIALDGPATVKAGQVFTVAVTVRVTGPPGVFGAQFTLDYLPDYFEVLEIIPNPELLVAVQSFDNEQGQIAFAASRYKDVPNFTGEVIFARIVFWAKAVDREDISPLVLKKVKLGAKGGSTIPTFSRDLFLTIER